MKKKIGSLFSGLKPGQKKLVVYGLLIGAFFLVVWVSFQIKQNKKNQRVQSTRTQSHLVEPILEPELIEVSKYREQRTQLESLRNELTQLKERPVQERVVVIKDKKQIPGIKVTVEGDHVFTEKVLTDDDGSNARAFIPSADDLVPRPPLSYPQVPASGRVSAPPVPSGGRVSPYQAGPPIDEYVGGIGMVSNHTASSSAATSARSDKGKKGKKKDEGAVVFLPPSFMEAVLLTGFDASTTGGQGASGGSEPVMLRVQTPAILPNYVKAQLEGCFIVAEARGNLAKERAEIRLNTLSCVGVDGTSVINAKIKGYVVDGRDGKNSLSGRVVSKMGATAARALIAGLFEGAGEAFTSAASTQSISALGTTSIVDRDELTQSAIGKGVSNASEQLSELYMELARQTSPVIEVLPAQKVTVVISEGVELKIKTYERVGGGNNDQTF